MSVPLSLSRLRIITTHFKKINNITIRIILLLRKDSKNRKHLSKDLSTNAINLHLVEPKYRHTKPSKNAEIPNKTCILNSCRFNAKKCCTITP